MKYYILFLLLATSLCSCGKVEKSSKEPTEKKPMISFIKKIDAYEANYKVQELHIKFSYQGKVVYQKIEPLDFANLPNNWHPDSHKLARVISLIEEQGFEPTFSISQ